MGLVYLIFDLVVHQQPVYEYNILISRSAVSFARNFHLLPRLSFLLAISNSELVIMDTLPHDFRPPPSADSSSPSPHHIPSSGSVSNTQLAALLSEAYRENDNLRKELLSAKKRAEKAERVSQIVNSDPSTSPVVAAGSATNGGGSGSATLDIQQLQQKHAETIRRLIDDYDEQLRSAHLARDEAEARKRVAQDGWDQLERYLADLELRAKDARSSFSRLFSGASSASSLSVTAIPSPLVLLSSSISSPSSAHPTQYAGPPMGPPGAVPSRHISRRSSSRSGNVIFPVLPPHPNPNPPSASGTSHVPGTRRPRTPSMDAYASNQPPTKRSRANADDQGGRESRTSYSEPVSLFSLFIFNPELSANAIAIPLFFSSIFSLGELQSASCTARHSHAPHIQPYCDG